MKRVVLDDSVAQPFLEARDAVQVCTRSGQMLEYFTPTCKPGIYDELDSPCTEEELHDRLREGRGRPLADILHDLEFRS